MKKITYKDGIFTVSLTNHRELRYNTNDNTLKLLDNRVQVVIKTISFAKSITMSEFKKYIEDYE